MRGKGGEREGKGRGKGEKREGKGRGRGGAEEGGRKEGKRGHRNGVTKKKK